MAADRKPTPRRASRGRIRPAAEALERRRLPATIVRCGPDEFAIRFDVVGAGRADLIRLIYSGRYSAAVPRIEPARVAAAVLTRVWR